MLHSALLVLSWWAALAAGLTQTYCSHQNTGAGSSSIFNQYQSNGACYDSCKATSAFAIVQGQLCWCSNYIPYDQESVSLWNTVCPGFGAENCGNPSSGLYGYVALPIAPSGTAGAASSTSAASSTNAASQAQSTVSSSSASTTPSPSVVVQVTTQAGTIVTQTVTLAPKATATSTSTAASTVQPQKSVSTGTIVGTVVGAVLGLALVALLALCLWRRKRSKDGPNGVNRKASLLSKTGLIGAAGHSRDPEKSGENPHDRPGGSLPSYNDVPAPAAAYDRPKQPDRRNSRPLVYDQRLNPAALMQNWQQGGSRESVNTMDDQRDYSRPLGVTNPDTHKEDD